MEPEFIIADEITTGLDANTKLEIMNLLDNIQKEQGVSVLLISHDNSVINRYCNRVVTIESGEVFDQKDGQLHQVGDNVKHKNFSEKSTDVKKEKVLSINGFCKSYSNSGQTKKALKDVSI